MRTSREQHAPGAWARRRRWSIALTSVAALLAPLAYIAPEFEVPGEAMARQVAGVLLHPIDALRSWSTSVRAAGPASAAKLDAIDVRDQRLGARLSEALERGANRGWEPGQLELVGVLRVEGPARRQELVLDTNLSRSAARDFSGSPVVHGEDFLGFVADVDARAARDEGRFDGRLRVQLLDRAPTRRELRRGLPRRRIIGLARSLRQPEAEGLRLLVEAAHPKAPFRLRVVRSAPRQLETWSKDVAPYVARTTRSDRLHPELPEGLVLGHVEDVGYRERAFVLERYVEPRFDARSLVRVGIVRRSGAKRLPKPVAVKRAALRAIWQSPRALAWRRALVTGAALERGAALVEGGRCLGRIAWARGSQGGARTLCDPSWTLPLLVLSTDGEAHALVVRGRGLARLAAPTEGGAVAGANGMLVGRFLILHPRRGLEGLTTRMRDAWVFTGADGASFPAGLLCGRVREQRGSELAIELLGLRAWPKRLACIVAPPRGVESAR